MWLAVGAFAVSAAAQAWALAGQSLPPLAGGALQSGLLQFGALAVALLSLLNGVRLSPDGGRAGMISGFLEYCPAPVIAISGFLILYGMSSFLTIPAGANAAEHLRGASAFGMALFFFAFATNFAVLEQAAADDDADG